MSTVDIDKAEYGYIKVSLDYAPTTNGKKFAKWCEEHGFTPLNGGRRAWSSQLSTYLRGADGVAYADGEPFLFDEEDLVDIAELRITLKAELLAKMPKQHIGWKQTPTQRQIGVSDGYNQAITEVTKIVEEL